MDNDNLDNIVLALLFSADEPLSLRKMTGILDDVPASDFKESVERWAKQFDDESWSIVLEKVAGGYQLSSRSQYAPYIARLYSGRRKLRLSKAALEALAIISYKQPITRAEVENVRGVGCGGVIGNLLERSLIRIAGKAKVLGAPFLYGTTQEFLEYLGLNSLKDLPSLEELEAILEREESAVSEVNNGDLPAETDVESGVTPEEAAAMADEDSIKVSEEVAMSPAAAKLGPDIDEPYHRPLGSPEDIDTDADNSDTAVENESMGEESPMARKSDDRDE
jgi:segregation and condensation protein B